MSKHKQYRSAWKCNTPGIKIFFIIQRLAAVLFGEFEICDLFVIWNLSFDI